MIVRFRSKHTNTYGTEGLRGKDSKKLAVLTNVESPAAVAIKSQITPSRTENGLGDQEHHATRYFHQRSPVSRGDVQD